MRNKVLELVGRVKLYVAKKKLELGVKWVTAAGLTACRIVDRAGTSYIVGRDGMYHKIGRGRK